MTCFLRRPISKFLARIGLDAVPIFSLQAMLPEQTIEVKQWKIMKSVRCRKRALTPLEDVAAMLNIGCTSAYTLVKEGHFKTVHIGTAIRIFKKSFDEWLEKLELQIELLNI